MISRYILIGGLGFIGKNIYSQIRKISNAPIIIIDDERRGSVDVFWKNSLLNESDGSLKILSKDARNVNMLSQFLTEHSAVFHLAGSWITDCVEDPQNAYLNNIALAQSIGEACLFSRVQVLVFSSSTSIYGSTVSKPLTLHTPTQCEDHYSASKKASEDILTAYYYESLRGNHQPFALSILRYLNVYGPHQHYMGGAGSVIANFIESSHADKPTRIYGYPTSKYDFVFSQDVAIANLIAAQKKGLNKYLVGTSHPISLNKLALSIWEAQGKTPLIEVVAPRGFVQPSMRVCSQRDRKKLFGGMQLTLLDKGLRDTIAAYRAHHLSIQS